MKKVTVLIIVAVMTVMMTACGNTVGNISLETGQNAIYIQEDGSVSYAVSETFDKGYYNKDDLEDKIESEVEAYNNSQYASVDDAVEVSRFKANKESATLVLNFITTYDFLSYSKKYNRVSEEEFYIGSIADNTECKIEGEFVSPDQKNTADKNDIKSMTDAEILIVNEQFKVQVDGTVQFMSTNCSVDEDGIITTAKADDGISYIIYKNK